MNELEILLQTLLDGQTLIEATLSGPRKSGEDAIRKIVVKPIQIKDGRRFQFASHAPRKVTHANRTPDDARTELRERLLSDFREARIITSDADVSVRVNRRGEAVITTKPARHAAPDLQHDRRKSYLIPEGQPNDFLLRLGVMGPNGNVLAARRDKFRQINRFLEIVGDVADALPPDRPLRVVDFGCGKSYLTFALYHYLHNIMQREVAIIGLDLKTDVVAQCSAIARDLHYDGLTFAVGDIAGYNGATAGVDMVVSLHACDTATDDALAQAIGWQSPIILAVPCCQHELFKQLSNDAMRPLLKHGLFRERLTALVTDAVRAELLERAGYAVQVLEFIEMEHTPKNLLLRAVKTSAPANRDKIETEYATFRDFWGVSPHLERVLPSRAALSAPLPREPASQGERGET